MTTLETNRAITSGRNASVFGAMFATIATWNDARVTRKALGRLSDRELDDIGLCRGDIETLTTDARR